MNTLKSRDHGVDVAGALYTPVNSTICHLSNNLSSYKVLGI